MLISLSLCVSGQFRATMMNGYSGGGKSWQVWSDGTNYRYEHKDNNDQLVVMIVRPEDNKAYVLMPDKKLYRQFTLDNFTIIMMDPVQGCVYIANKYLEKEAGHEKVAGYDCVKKEYYMIYQGDTGLVNVISFSEELNFPLRLEAGTFKKLQMEISDIRKWKPEKDYFMLPAGYTEADETMPPVKH